MPGNLPIVALGMDPACAHTALQTVHTIAPEDATDAGVEDFELMKALKIPDDADRPEGIVAAQVQDFLGNCLRRPVRMVVRNRSLIGRPGLAVICESMQPSIEAGSPDPEISTGLADVT